MESTGGARPTATVQELAEALGAPSVPAQYVARGDHGHKPTAAAAATVPVIDLGRLFQQDSTAAAVDEATKLRFALQSWGLFLVNNHGVEAAVMDGMLAASRDFFRRPPEEKQIYSNLIGGERFQLEGYGTDRVNSPDQILDWCDRLYLKVEPEDERSLALWPAHPQTFRDLLHEFSTKCRGVKQWRTQKFLLSRTRRAEAKPGQGPGGRDAASAHGVKDSLLRAMAKLLELDDDYFVDQLGEKADTNVRFNYYPECPRPELVFGLKPHSDGTVLSVLMVDESVGGLQVLKDGVWFDVPIVPRTLLVNIGDQTEIISNGIFRSPVHRVLTNADRERLSVTLFYSVDPEREIEPAAQLVDEKRPALYRKVKVKDYLAGFLGRFSEGAMAIDAVKM